MEATSVRSGVETILQAYPPRHGSYLVGFVMIAEYLDPDGHRQLAQITSDNMTPWQRSGYLYDALEGEDWEG